MIACGKQQLNYFSGDAIGTSYNISYVGKENSEIPKLVDSLLKEIHKQFSVFDDNSLVSAINRGEKTEMRSDFLILFEKSMEISQMTHGAFDITVAPLADFWGFGSGDKQVVFDNNEQNNMNIDSIKQFTGYNKVKIIDGELVKEDHRIKLNFNAIAKGYAVDRIFILLQNLGYSDLLIEVGGEVRSSGSKNGKPWRVGIQRPTADKWGTIEADYTFSLNNMSIATSGNYRNYFEDEEGMRYTHIIDPFTGYPQKSNLLSVTVIASECVTADALATAFMVMGLEQSLLFLDFHPEIAACFIFNDDDGFSTRMTFNFPEEGDF